MVRQTLTLAAIVLTTPALALFSGNAYFFSAPNSQLGPITSNTLVLNNGPYGFTVSGVVQIQVPAGSVSGTLLEWTVDRPLNPNWGSGLMQTTTILTGFSTPPSGTYATTSGYTTSFFNQYPGVSNSTIPITLNNGSATWNNVFVTSSIFTYTSGGSQILRQRFELDGVKISGPAGTWIVDVPVDTLATPVPEPATLALLAATLPALTKLLKPRKTSPDKP